MIDVEEIVRETLCEILPEKADKLKSDRELGDLLLDSLDMLEFKMRLEEKLNVELEVEVFESFATLHEISRRIAAALQRV
jgi:acyl carrier protein